jgi:NAD(P) transhydrogenase subunit beta
VIVLKRGRGAGFAGIPNPLFSMDKTSMLFGNAKQTVESLVSGVKQA